MVVIWQTDSDASHCKQRGIHFKSTVLNAKFDTYPLCARGFRPEKPSAYRPCSGWLLWYVVL